MTALQPPSLELIIDGSSSLLPKAGLFNARKYV